MEELSKEILSQLLPAEKEFVPQKAVHPSDVDHWTPAVLLERAAYLRKMARHGDGSAGETLKEFPRHAAMLSVRHRDGQAEVHENFADLFYVLDGRATLLSGGAVVGAVEVSAGETRGVALEGSVRQELRSGDLAHVPAGVPHQMLVSSENAFTALVLKIQEKE
jgi:uncharacterized RmlC-like cupin family protein